VGLPERQNNFTDRYNQIGSCVVKISLYNLFLHLLAVQFQKSFEKMIEIESFIFIQIKILIGKY